MKQQDCISTAIDVIFASNIPDEYLVDAINDQARQMAMVNPDELWEDHLDTH